MDEIKIGAEEIYLAPEEEKIKNAKEIAEASKNAEKYIFCVYYEYTEKTVVLSEIKRLECEILEQSDAEGYVTIRGSKLQLAAIKSLNCIEKVEILEESAVTNFTKKISLNETENNDIMNMRLVDEPSVLAQTAEAVSANDGIMPVGYNDASYYANNQSNIIQLNLNTWKSGEICCPGAEIWYKFIPTTTAYYTIYTSGLLDTKGYIYDSGLNYIDEGDDEGTARNFKMVEYLIANQTYYIKVNGYGSSVGNFKVIVTNTVLVESVTILNQSVTINKGKTKTLSANVLPSYATDKTLWWESDNTNVVTVDHLSGEITAVNGGKACVCAFSRDGSAKSGCCEVIVNVPVESVTVDTSTRTMRVGESDLFTATVCPLNASDKRLNWTSSNTAVATVDSEGYVTAKSQGTTTIKATAKDGTGKYGVCALTVKPAIHVTGVNISSETLTMNVGEKEELYAIVTPDNATNRNVTWRSSNPNVAEVSWRGEITAKSAGTATITVTTYDGSFVASCEVTVYIDTVTIQKDGAFNKVVFKNSGKVWRCINHDMIFEDVPFNSPLFDRSNLNFHGHTEYNVNTITYTDDEIKLLYAIDPYGVADYVRRYANKKPALEDRVEYKDYIFELLFKRKPKYFARTPSGVWYQVSAYDEIEEVLSESETLFGGHKIWDEYTFIQIAKDVVAIASLACSPISPLGAWVAKCATVESALKAFFFIAGGLADDFISSGIDTVLGDAAEVTSLTWAYTFVMAYKNIVELATEVKSKLNYYPQIFDYYIDNLKYDVNIEFISGEISQLKDISNALKLS